MLHSPSMGGSMTKKAAQATPNHFLRMARLERGWTQKEVADRIGAPLDLNVTRWERGTARPSAYYVQKLCELFGKSASELGLLPPRPESAASSKAEPTRSERELPTGTITLLFADMEGSTRLLQQLGDRYVSVLADYRQLLRAAFGQWRGHEVDTGGRSCSRTRPASWWSRLCRRVCPCGIWGNIASRTCNGPATSFNWAARTSLLTSHPSKPSTHPLTICPSNPQRSLDASRKWSRSVNSCV